MHDLGRIVYLDMQKTGSTRTSDFLNKCSTLRLKKYLKHQVLGQTHDTSGAFVFNTIRNPFDLYVSSFRYGCQGPDSIRLYLHHKGKVDVGKLYQPTSEAFNAWIAFILDPANAKLVGDGFDLVSRHGIGLMSYRHLINSIKHPNVRLLRGIKSAADVDDLYETEKIVDLVLRNEDLDQGLRDLATVRFPDYFDPEFVRLYFERRPRLNVGEVKAAEDFEFTEEMRALVRQREDFLFRRFYAAEAVSSSGNAIDQT